MFWASAEHEIDFVLQDGSMYEVKAGQASPLEFAWLKKVFPKGTLNIVSDSTFETQNLRSTQPVDFLLGAKSRLAFDSDRVPWGILEE